MNKIYNIIFVILGFCFAICGFFVYQLSQYKLPEMTLEKTIPKGQSTKAPEPPPAVPLVDLPSDRNIFKSPWTEEEISGFVALNTPPPKPHLSTICWSYELPLAIINGEILSEGDEDSESQFLVENITRDRAGIRFIGNGEHIWLTLGDEEEELQTPTTF